jgi:HTH-type transcriptional regulator, sugar sensing transcriptional regulator
MKSSFIEFLEDLGLSDNEARVYFASLSLGPSTIMKIADAAEIKRTTVYSVAESLQKRGLINIQLKGFKKLYSAEDPEKLETILDLRRKKLNDLLPEFKAMYNLNGGESFIRYYSGFEGVKNVYESMLKDAKPHDYYYVMSETEKLFEQEGEYFEDFVSRRAKLNVDLRILLQDSQKSRQIKHSDTRINKVVKILPPDTRLTTNLTIIPKRVAIHQITPPVMSIVIENKSVIQMHKDTFDIIWNSLSF